MEITFYHMVALEPYIETAVPIVENLPTTQEMGSFYL
jgi:hypothetical protein